MNPAIDLIVPVFNSPHHARACLRSIFTHADVPCRLIVVDDCSDDHTAGMLRELMAAAPDAVEARYLRNEQNLGYLRSVNRGIREGGAPVVVLVNSDTLLTPGALNRVLSGFGRDPKIGVINPVSNWANWTRIPFPDGANIYSLTDAVRRLGSGKLPDIRNASGFFFAMRRELIQDIGDFDEAYGFGYWEETDFCMRALAKGWRVVVDDSLYIFHHGWGSFQEEGRNENMRRNREIFMARWQKPFAEAEAWWKRNDPVKPLSGALERAFSAAPAAGMPNESRIRDRIEALRSGASPALREGAASGRPAERPRVIYVLPAVALYGGIISVLQVV
ncbi:MAG TPA: glycosyltransferase family 2 protein, partial [Candidatus Hydrogenedentes bacterium]|nr:glycosyltransferase family 2 protein [Candidatus Hydrogenedentota bacterium]